MKLCLLDANIVILERFEVFSTVCDEVMFWIDTGGQLADGATLLDQRGMQLAAQVSGRGVEVHRKTGPERSQCVLT